ncbi:MAG: CPBP family intramembrane metalloprotease [Oscillospiraceae bacterium]|nr:CPBP family intramembrane metalloprotease [Oscillospiraceae bacterium]
MKRHKDLAVFLLCAFLIPAVALGAQSLTGNAALRFVLYGIQAASPTISALIVFIMNGQLAEKIGGMFSRGHIPAAILLPPLTVCAVMFPAKTVYCIVTGTAFETGDITSARLIILLWALIAEEIGWRGFLAPKLMEYGADRRLIPLITGAIWCLWHYHFLIQGSIDVPIPLFFAGCVIESYIYAFFMELTCGNILSAMMYHFSWNLFLHIAAVGPSENGGSIMPYLLMVMIEAVITAVILIHGVKSGGKERPG